MKASGRNKSLVCCVVDDGLARRRRPSGGACKPPTGAMVKSHGAERDRKRPSKIGQVKIRKMNESEPYDEASKYVRYCQNYSVLDLNRKSITETWLLVIRQSVQRGHDSNLGHYMEHENWHIDAKCLIKYPRYCFWRTQGKGTSGEPTRSNTDAICQGGLVRSSVETSVMEVERRD
jgi:hypothetical protein